MEKNLCCFVIRLYFILLLGTGFFPFYIFFRILKRCVVAVVSSDSVAVNTISYYYLYPVGTEFLELFFHCDDFDELFVGCLRTL
jgi:hypothetical protein